MRQSFLRDSLHRPLHQTQKLLQKVHMKGTLQEQSVKTISYIPARQGETPARFARRWIAYYRDRIAKFNTRVEKMLNKHRTDKLKTATKSLMISDMIPTTGHERD